jgi:hypothetical protein
MKSRVFKLYGVLLLLLSATAGAQQRHQFTVQQAVDYARKNSSHG